MQNPLSRYWLLIGTGALAIAGLFALVLVIARTPQLASLPLFASLFHKSLVVHVDLSVLTWFLSIACLLWSLAASGSRPIFPYIEESALICFSLGTLAITASSFDTSAEALMSNYIPVITSPLFFLGLGLLLAGSGLMLVRLFTARQLSPGFNKPEQLGIFSGGIIAVIAIMAFIWSHYQMPHDLAPTEYYDMMFWGGGHVLQFVHAQLLLICWLLLARALKKDLSIVSQYLYALFSFGLVAAFITPFVYLFTKVDSGEHHQFFTSMMIMTNGIAPFILAWLLLPALKHKSDKPALWSSLLMSVILFLYGGILGGMINGQNVVIPAHYHGSIVGITLGFMGLAYLLLPQFGWRDVSRWKLAFWQPIVYGGGQLLHVSGLAWSGGYGVLRKTPGGEGLPMNVKAALGIMGLGGLFAIIGGFMFVIVICRAVRKAA